MAQPNSVVERPRMMRSVLALIWSAVLASVSTAEAQQGQDPRVADLVQAGKIRVGLFPPQFTRDPVTRELKSAWVEIARGLAARVGVQLELLEHPTPPSAMECIKVGACDVVYGAINPSRALEVGYSPPILQLDFTYLIPSGSTIRSVVDSDKAEVRIAVVRNHSATEALSGILKQARMVYGETPDETFELLRAGQADVMASARNALLNYSSQLPGSRVLEDRYETNLNRMLVPKAHTGRLTYISEFVEEAKVSGLVQKAIDHSGPRGAMVAPPGDSK